MKKPLDELGERKVQSLQHQISEMKQAGKTVENSPEMLALVSELEDLTGESTPAESANACGCEQCDGSCGGDDLAAALGSLGGMAIPIPAGALGKGGDIGGLLGALMGRNRPQPKNPKYDIHSDPMYAGMMSRYRGDLIHRHAMQACSEIVNTVNYLNKMHGSGATINDLFIMFEYMMKMDSKLALPDQFHSCGDPEEVLNRFKDLISSANAAEIAEDVTAEVRTIVYGASV